MKMMSQSVTELLTDKLHDLLEWTDRRTDELEFFELLLASKNESEGQNESSELVEIQI